MPNRIIKESINESLMLSECSTFAIDLYKRLITYADDYGRFNADTTIMRARLYPREYESVTEEDIFEALVELIGEGKIEFYSPDVFNQAGKKGVYGVFPHWAEHQRQRDSKKKCPDPDDTRINDWYLRRFVSVDMKERILERDNFKCQLCGKYVTTCRDAKRFVKLGSGLYHLDHIVPVHQGGRATLENLRVTCPECNLKRKQKFSFQEILEETLSAMRSEIEGLAADCGNSPQLAADCSLAHAGAESESESESESNNTPHNTDRDRTPAHAQEIPALDGGDSKYGRKEFEADLSVLSKKLSESVVEWMKYKKEKHQPYKPRGIKSLITQVSNYAKQYGEDVMIQTIANSMANGYMGITFDKAEKNSGAEGRENRGIPESASTGNRGGDRDAAWGIKSVV